MIFEGAEEQLIRLQMGGGGGAKLYPLIITSSEDKIYEPEEGYDGFDAVVVSLDVLSQIPYMKKMAEWKIPNTSYRLEARMNISDDDKVKFRHKIRDQYVKNSSGSIIHFRHRVEVTMYSCIYLGDKLIIAYEYTTLPIFVEEWIENTGAWSGRYTYTYASAAESPAPGRRGEYFWGFNMPGTEHLETSSGEYTNDYSRVMNGIYMEPISCGMQSSLAKYYTNLSDDDICNFAYDFYKDVISKT